MSTFPSARILDSLPPDVRAITADEIRRVQVEVRGKEQPPQGHEARPRASDGVTLWVDTRDARTSHRATRYCHQFHLLPTGGGPDNDEPVFGIFAAVGTQVALLPDRAIAFATVRQHELEPVSVH